VDGVLNPDLFNKFNRLIEKISRSDLYSQNDKYVWFALNGARKIITRKNRDKVEKAFKN
jgi:hypothetical protein